MFFPFIFCLTKFVAWSVSLMVSDLDLDLEFEFEFAFEFYDSRLICETWCLPWHLNQQI